MSTITQIRQALAQTASDGVASDVVAYPTAPDNPQFPAFVVVPRECNFAKAFNRGLDEWRLDLWIMFARADTQTTQDSLDAFINGSGPDSVREVLFNNPTLGLPDTDAFVEGVFNYGAEFKAAGVPNIGATLRVVVRTDGTA